MNDRENVVIAPDSVWFAWATGHHQGIKFEGVYKKGEKAQRRKEHIDPAQRAVPRRQNVQETAQNVKGVRIRLSLASTRNPLSLAG